TWNCCPRRRSASISANCREMEGRTLSRPILSGRYGGRPSIWRIAIRPAYFRQLRPWTHPRNHRRERRIDNSNFRAAPHDFISINDIAGTHPNPSVTSGEAKVPFLRRTMNVNRARICIRVLRLTASQPQNAGDDWIAPWRIWYNDLASWPSIFENGARRGVIANFLCDLQFAQWGTRAAR